MVQSIWLEFDEIQDRQKIFKIISNIYQLDKYNNTDRPIGEWKTDEHVNRWSVEGGFTLKDDNILKKIVRFNEPNYNSKITCSCNFCNYLGTFGNAITFFFGIRISSRRIGRNIWLMGDYAYLSNARLRLHYSFLKIIKKILKENGIKSKFDFCDVDIEILKKAF